MVNITHPKIFLKIFFKKHLTARIKVSILSLAQFKNLLGPLAQLVEHLTLNQGVVGSRPTWVTMWPVGQAVKTPPFHGGIGGSIPPPVTIWALSSAGRASALQAECQRFDPVSAHHFSIKYGPVVQLVRMPPCHGGGRGFESHPGRHCLGSSVGRAKD